MRREIQEWNTQQIACTGHHAKAPFHEWDRTLDELMGDVTAYVRCRYCDIRAFAVKGGKSYQEISVTIVEWP